MQKKVIQQKLMGGGGGGKLINIPIRWSDLRWGTGVVCTSDPLLRTTCTNLSDSSSSSSLSSLWLARPRSPAAGHSWARFGAIFGAHWSLSSGLLGSPPGASVSPGGAGALPRGSWSALGGARGRAWGAPPAAPFCLENLPALIVWSGVRGPRGSPRKGLQ